MKQIERWIPNLTGVLTIVVLLCSFILSFSNLRYAAELSRIDPVLTWAWPVCIDSLLVSGSLLILRNSLRQESTRFGWIVLSVFTLVSILFNVAVSPNNLLSQASHAIPPITLMVSVEILLSIVRSDLSPKGNTPVTYPDVTSERGDVTPPVTVLHQGAGKGVTADQVLQFFRENPSASFVTAAANLNIARQTVSRHVARLLEDGRLEKDGNQFVIPDRDGREYA
ncbi:MAG: DUF2637 domain-containing protein [Methanospirillum sp.]|uniref:DUF2637 domain-containing protein n=1 Tax=Methanospirillum sp. TaxID=45200 RepID=UPI0023721358|nr:DUF2637 domain-containing protein [Methanospirillum sp.]MDD1730243.1 DUF2637 domain-containing protein [Methanospirillum sp.]